MHLELINLSVEAEGDRTILQNISIDVFPGTITTFLGETGAGKSMLGKAVSGLLPFGVSVASGEIFIDGKLVDGLRLGSLRGEGIFYVPQDASASLNPLLRIRKQVDEVSKVGLTRVMEVFSELGFEVPRRVLESYPFQLSVGECRRCLLVMAVLMQSRLLILDEPVSSLDSGLKAGFIRLIKNIRESHGFTLLLITHDLEVAVSLSDYIYVMYRGRIVDGGKPHELMASPRHEYTRELFDCPT